MKIVFLLSTLIIFSACTPTTTVEPEANSGNINSSAPYLWSSDAFPRNLQISKDFTDAEVANIKDMAEAWEDALSDKKDFFINTNTTPEISKANLNLDDLGDDGINGIYKIKNWPKDLNGSALAVTQIFGRRHNIGDGNEYVKIEHADILINDHFYTFRTDDSKASWTYDLRTVVLHELGHFLGLGHKYGTTVMVPSIGSLTENREPTSMDINDLADKYNISLGSSAAGAVVASARTNYVPKANDTGKMIKIMIELLADGECVHKEDGVVIQRHRYHK